MKKILICSLALGCALLLAGCGATPADPAVSEDPAAGVTAGAVNPLPSTMSVDDLDNASFAAGFDAKGVYLNDDGAMVIDLTVYDYELYDIVDVSTLKVGDTIVINGQNVVISSIEEANGLIAINGGLEEGGYWLGTDDESSAYYEVLEDAAKRYVSVGKITLPVGQDFVFVDNADPEKPDQKMLAGDFIQEIPKTDEVFSPNAVTVTVKDGFITNVDRRFVP